MFVQSSLILALDADPAKHTEHQKGAETQRNCPGTGDSKGTEGWGETSPSAPFPMQGFGVV